MSLDSTYACAGVLLSTQGISVVKFATEVQTDCD